MENKNINENVQLEELNKKLQTIIDNNQAQKEEGRRLKIKCVNNQLTEEKKKRSRMAILAGTCFAGMVASYYLTGMDQNSLIETEIKALSSLDSLKEYFMMITPAVYGTLTATAVSFTKFLKHNKKYKNAQNEYSNLMDEENLENIKSNGKTR